MNGSDRCNNTARSTDVSFSQKMNYKLAKQKKIINFSKIQIDTFLYEEDASMTPTSLLSLNLHNKLNSFE
jgi:hypothetical protein